PTVGVEFVPTPSNGISSAGPTTRMRPPLVPVAVGLNVTFNRKLCPAPNDIGKFAPLTLKPGPVVFSPLNDIACVRVLVSTNVVDVLLPTVTEPNDTLAGDGVSGCAVVPRPPSETVID